MAWNLSRLPSIRPLEAAIASRLGIPRRVFLPVVEMLLLSGGGTSWAWRCSRSIISMSLVNLRGVAVGEEVLAVAPVAWVTGGVVPVTVVTDFKVSIWCGEVIAVLDS